MTLSFSAVRAWLLAAMWALPFQHFDDVVRPNKQQRDIAHKQERQ